MAANKERTFIIVKLDGVHRGLVGKIIERFEKKGFKLVAMKFARPVVPMVWVGLSVVKSRRQIWALPTQRTLCPVSFVRHSDAVESANKEISLWFDEKELVTGTAAASDWVYK